MVFQDAGRERLFRDAMQALRKRHDDVDEIAVTLLQTLSRSLSEAKVDRIPPKVFALLAATGLEILRERQPDEIKVHLSEAEIRREGKRTPITLVQTVIRDQAFLYDTLLMAVDETGLEPLYSVNYVLSVARNASGISTAFGAPTSDRSDRESFIQFVLPRLDEDRRESLPDTFRHRLALARASVGDFPAMRAEVAFAQQALRAMSDGLSKADEHEAFKEASDFLGWLLDEHFVMMGLHVEHAAREPEAPGGWRRVRERERGTEKLDPLELTDTDQVLPLLEAAAGNGTVPVLVRKVPRASMVHRPGTIDEIVVVVPEGPGECRVVVLRGLLAFRAIRQPGGEIPLLRLKLDQLVTEKNLIRDTFAYRTCVDAFNSLPAEYLFEADTPSIAASIEAIQAAEEQDEVRIHIRLGPEGRSLYAFAVVPKHVFNEDLRQRLQDALRRHTRAIYDSHRVVPSRLDTMVIHFYVSAGTAVSDDDARALEEMMLRVSSPWAQRLRERLHSRFPRYEAEGLYKRYARAFSPRYREETSPDRAMVDVAHLEETRITHRLSFDVDRAPAGDGEEGTVLLRIYQERRLVLSEVLPVLDRFGLLVLGEECEQVDLRDGPPMLLDTYRVRPRPGQEGLFEHRHIFIDALRAAFEGQTAIDILCALCITAKVSWRELDLVRTAVHYLRVAGAIPSASVARHVLLQHPAAVSDVVELFRARFDPRSGSESKRRREVARVEKKIRAYREGLSTYEEERIIAAVAKLVGRGITRTNLFLPHRRMHHLVSIKIDTERAGGLIPEPRPRFEIFVQHARFEAVHMRAGPVARGGIRHSDRGEDFRTEILGLMLTQQTKNSVIVPMGAKGGFILKEAPWELVDVKPHNKKDEPAPDPAEWAYDHFMEGLLDVTDNQTSEGVKRPTELVVYDDDDPYLVVAADKGTAQYSDRANRVAARYGYWLGDAFASGGSVGYDHKEMGITAKGAWIASRRHFLEMGVVPETDPIRVVGIGDVKTDIAVVGIHDMSGDVFGNGMLLSGSMRLVAAFNHKHIFLDPDPDPAISLTERQRLFDLPRSQWTDYDREKMGPGGGVYRRDAPELPISPEARAMLKLPDGPASGRDVVTAMLRMDADLLWAGGIGTYVKSSAERDADVRDRPNDAVRVDASELGVKVIGEGANLAVTQEGRVQFALKGGKVNTDALDNACGVACSDHEVNLKILLGKAMEAGSIDEEERQRLLRLMEEDVGKQVLSLNARQALMLSIDERRVARSPMPHLRTQGFLERSGVLDPRLQRLPKRREILRRVGAGHSGYTRPELAVLCGHAKIHLQRALSLSSRPSPFADRLVRSYFPTSLPGELRNLAPDHPLFRRIAALMQAQRIVDEGGATAASYLVRAADRSPVVAADAWFLMDEILGGEKIRHGLSVMEEPEPGRIAVPPAALYTTRGMVADGVTEAALWLLRVFAGARFTHLLRRSERFIKLCEGFLDGILDHLSDPLLTQAWELQSSLVNLGSPRDIASRAAVARFLPCVISLAELSRREGKRAAPSYLVALYLEVARQTRLLDIYFALSNDVRDDEWEDRAVRTVKTHFLGFLDRLTHAMPALLGDRGAKSPDPQAVAEVLNDRLKMAPLLEEVDQALGSGAGLGQIIVFSEAYRRRVHQADALLETSRRTSGAKGEGAAKRKKRK